MTENPMPEIEFPTDYMFKAFGKTEAGDSFRLSVKNAINATVTCPDDAIRVRQSSGGKYLCVTALTHLSSKDQLLNIYKDLNSIEDLMFLL